MAVFIADSIMDLLLAGIALSDRMFLCSQLPTTYIEASSTYRLATENLTTGLGNGDFTAANGGSDGRKVTVTAKAGIAVLASGTWTHVALGSNGDSTLRAVWALPAGVALSSGNTASVAALTHTVRDPTAV